MDTESVNGSVQETAGVEKSVSLVLRPSNTREGISDLVACSLCSMRYGSSGPHIPKILPCLDTFCEQCLWNLFGEATSASTRFACPVCGLELSRKTPGTLQINYVALQMLCEACDNLFAFLIFGQADLADPRSCGACDKPPTHKCLQCPDGGEWLCAFHVGEHNKLKVSKLHEPVAIDTLKREGAKIKWECPIHHLELERYCETCKENLCQSCVTISHPSPDHAHAPFSDHINNAKSDVTQHLPRVQAQLKELNPSQEGLLKLEERLAEKVSAIEGRIDATVDEIISRVRECGEKLKEDIRSEATNRAAPIVQSRKAVQSRIRQVDKTLEISDFLLHRASDSTFFGMKEVLLNAGVWRAMMMPDTGPMLGLLDIKITERRDRIEMGLEAIAKMFTTDRPMMSRMRFDPERVSPVFSLLDGNRVCRGLVKSSGWQSCTSLQCITRGVNFFAVRVVFEETNALVGLTGHISKQSADTPPIHIFSGGSGPLAVRKQSNTAVWGGGASAFYF